MKFTNEEGSKQINYLDLEIKINDELKFEFKIFRKLTHLV